MKTLKKLLSTCTTATLLLTACVNETPYYGKGPEGETSAETGFLTVGDMDLRVVYDAKTETGWDDAQGSAAKAPSTRSNPTADEIVVEIVNEASTTVAKKTYGEWKAMTAPIEMPVGSYTLKAYSAETVPSADWECPVYSTEKAFSIRKGETTHMPDLVCTLANIKVTVGYAADLADLLSDDTAADITIAGNSLHFAKSETRAAYFQAVQETNTLRIEITGTFTDTGKSVTLSKTINNVRAGQWRKITFIIENTDKGEIEIGLTIDSFIQDEEIVVDGTSGLWEPVIGEEEETATIEWPGNDLSTPLRLSADMFDNEGNCTSPVVLDLKAPHGISALAIGIGSDNQEFLAQLSGMGLNAPVDLCTVTAGSTLGNLLSGMGLPTAGAVTGKTSLALPLTGMMPQLYTYEGTHTIALSMSDGPARSTVETTLTIVVNKQPATAAPVIEWVNDKGYVFDQPQTLVADMTIQIDIEHSAPITAFEVTIDSKILSGLMAGVLPEHFDLCTVEGDTAETLKSFGFPTGAEVNEAHPLTFDITQFVEVLMALDAGEHKFILSVTDSAGNNTTKTLHLINVK